MFMGTFYNSIDAKNRMIVPAKHRDELGYSCVVTQGLDKCLNIYTLDDWKKEMAKIETLPSSNPKVRAFIRHFCGNATECEIDKQGRISMTQDLVKYADISKELVTVGAMQKIEIWSKEVWEASEGNIRMSSDEFADALESFNF